MKLYAAILCGGKGERFWPKSRRALPKQFISIVGDQSMTQETSRRIKPLCPPGRQFFIAPGQFGAILRKQLPQSRRNFVFEPVGRNTAPAIALAAAYLVRRDKDATMVVLPADHLIENQVEFIRNVRMAADLAQQGLFVTFGIPPDRADTGYGYIELGATLASQGNLAAYRVSAFREKPDIVTARRYVAAGNYAWNSGMFVWRADAFLRAVKQHMPEFASALERFGRTIGTRREAAALKRLYAAAPSVSVDYAIMEKATNIAAVKATFDWDDVGSWLALSRHIAPDADGNAVQGRCVTRASAGCIVDADEGTVALLGVRDLVVVRSGAVVLVAHRDALDGIKELVARVGDSKATKDLL